MSRMKSRCAFLLHAGREGARTQHSVRANHSLSSWRRRGASGTPGAVAELAEACRVLRLQPREAAVLDLSPSACSNSMRGGRLRPGEGTPPRPWEAGENPI